MSSLALYPYQKVRRYPAPEDHHKLLNLQLKQKYLLNSRIRKLEAEANQLEIYHSPQHSRKSEIKEKRFIQQSTFLPAISKKENYFKIHQRRHSYGDFFNQPTLYGTADSDYEVTNQINQCQLIIQNLKKLTNINKNRAEKQFFSRDSKRKYVPHKPQYQRQPSFMLSRDDSEDNFFNSNKTKRKSVLKKYSNIFQYTNGKSKAKVKENIKEREQISNSYEDFGQFESRVKDNSIWQEQQSNTEKIDHSNERKRQLTKVKQQNYGQVSQFTNKNNEKDAEPDRQMNQQDDIINENSKEERQWKQLLKKQQQQLKKAQRRQKFLVKFLAKAKARGFELQRKITQHKTKNNSLIASKQKQNPQQSNKKQAEKLQELDSQQSEIHSKNDQNQLNEKESIQKLIGQEEKQNSQKEQKDDEEQAKQEKGQANQPHQQPEEKQKQNGKNDNGDNEQNKGNVPTQQIVIKLIEQNS